MQVSQKQAVDIDFRNITYAAGNKKATNILKGINGCFRSGNLIGILGPSGAGKTTLLNILAGYIYKDVYGVIKINGEQRNMHTFKKVSCYIMQEDVLQKQLYVNELVGLVANLKLGMACSSKDKRKIIDSVVKVMGLEKCLDTRTEDLSGGQHKRLAIALELINNPPVMFLDEPTTGLDNVVAKQCIQILKTLANQGRTIICTIHQPADSLFYLFDQVYFISNGQCVYNGSVPQIVPYLSDMNFQCPTNYNPADYMLEVITNNSEAVYNLSKVSMNGMLITTDSRSKIDFKRPPPYLRENSLLVKDIESYENFPNAFHVQVIILLSRMFMQMSRNKWSIAIQVIHHTISSLAVGLSFFWIGDNASEALANYKYFMVIVVFYLYTYVMGPILLFPFEIELIRREYFNRWYGLKAYYTALTLSTLPAMVLLSVIFNVIIYTLANQPMEAGRFFVFNVICILVAINSYGLGITIGSLFKCTAGAVIGSGIGALLILSCMYGMGYGDGVSPFAKGLLFISFTRQGLTGISCSILQERPPMNCTDEYFCYLKDPDELLQIMGMKEANINTTIYILIFLALAHRLVAYLAMKRKVAPDTMLLCKYF